MGGRANAVLPAGVEPHPPATHHGQETVVKLSKNVWRATGSMIVGAAMTLASVSACGSGHPQNDDLKNVPPSYPNYAELVINVDGYPNVMMLCVHGAGIATTQRPNSNAAAFLVPEWDAFCKTQEGKQATQNGQP